ncbi:MAG: GHMP kinase [Pseudomonadota bacterium]
MSTSVTTNVPERDSLARAPGKIILSGEHSVVYGAPALAVAVEHHTEVWFTPMHRAAGLRTAFENLSAGATYPLDMLRSFKTGLDRRFDAFVRGDLPVREVLQRPDDLAVYTMASLHQFLPMPGVTSTRRLPTPGKLSSRSDLPLGAGMGSSASVIAATSVLYEALMALPQTPEERFERVRFCERLQHGRGSAIDAAAVVYGGLIRVDDGELSHPKLAESHGLADGQGWYWVLHGIPASPTGECVAAVREGFGSDKALWDAFAATTQALQDSLDGDTDPTDAIRKNHSLLNKIGVVPEDAARFIEAVEAAGGAAKVSGAGAVRGDKAGVILVHMDDPQAMETLMASYPDRRWERLRLSGSGAHLRRRANEPAA